MFKPRLRDIIVVIGTLIIVMSGFWIYTLTTDNPVLKAQYYEQAYNQGRQELINSVYKSGFLEIQDEQGNKFIYKQSAIDNN